MKASRSAFTLIELLVVMAVFSVVFATASLSMFALFRTSDGVTTGLQAALQQDRFAAQLRRDAHASLEVKTSSAPQSPEVATILQLSQPDGRVIEYRLQPEQIEREVRSADQILSVDSFRVPPRCDIGWMVDRQRLHPLVTVQLCPHPGCRINAVRQPAPVPVVVAVGIVTCSPASNTQPRNNP